MIDAMLVVYAVILTTGTAIALYHWRKREGL